MSYSNQPLRTLSCTFFIFFLFISFISGAEKFIGGGGDNLFSNPANWDGGSLPQAGDDIEIKADCVFDQAGAIEYGNLKIKNGATLSWANATYTLSIEDLDDDGSGGILDMSNAGTLIIRGEWKAKIEDLDFIAGSGTVDFQGTGNNTEIPDEFLANIAYQWGNHADEGYLTSETDPIFTASPAGGITNGDISTWNASQGDVAAETARAIAAEAAIQADVDANEIASDAADAAQTTALQAYTDQAETDATNAANAHSDAQDGTQTTALQAYADQAETDAVNTANAHSDAQDGTQTTALQAYADQAETDAVNAANAHSDAQDGTQTTALQAYADQAETDAVNAANAHSDAQDGTQTTALQAYADQAETDAVNAANAHSDAQDGTQTTALQAYADQAETDAVNAANAHSDAQDGTQTTALQAYADQAETDATNAANAHSDAQDATQTTALQAYADQAETDAVTAANTHSDNADTAQNTAISNNATNIANHNTADGDLSATNEIQDLSLAGNTLSLSNDASSVDLSGYLDNTDTQLTEEQVDIFVSNNGYLTSFSEIDPVYSAAPASGIISGDITNWNTAHSWGDHASAGYLNSLAGAVLTTGDQTISGIKTFNSDAIINAITVGKGSGDNGVIRSHSTVLGLLALNNNTTGQHNTAIGAFSQVSNLTGWDNTSHGYQTLAQNVSGKENTAIGSFVLQFSTGGDYNTATGSKALRNNTGSWNTANGAAALQNNTSGVINTALGAEALKANIDGDNNVATGNQSLFHNSSGNRNTANGVAALWGNTTGEFNTSIGYDALRNNITGSNNTAIGYQADASLGNLTNATAIGNSAIVNASNKVQIGNGSVNAVQLGTGSNVTLETGLIKLTGGAPGSGKVLTSDASGNATWQTLSTPAETDPLYSADPASGIASVHINEWNAAYAWGNHASAGYLNSLAGAVLTTGAQSISGIKTFTSDALINGVTAGRGAGGNQFNTAFGNTAMATSNGGNNTAFGWGTLNKNTSRFNTAVGHAVLNQNTTGLHNTAIGHVALVNNTTGEANTAIGSQALASNTTGGFNTAAGYIALRSNTTGSENTAYGQNNLSSNTIGGQNTSVGGGAMSQNNSGSANSAFGLNALFLNTNGFGNTGNGYGSLINNTTGGTNTAMGYNSLLTNSTGSDNTGIGSGADVSVANLTNATAIGANAFVNASNKIRLGNSSISSLEAQVALTVASDQRIKNQVKENVPGLEFIKQLRPVTYHYDVKKHNKLLGVENESEDKSKYDMEKISFTGFLAQDVDAAAQKIGYDFSGVDKSGDIMGIRYSAFVMPLVKGMQEQQSEIEVMKEQINERDNRIAELEDKMDVLIQQMELILKTQAEQESLLNDSDRPSIEQNAPNPFGDMTSIKYYLPQSSNQAELRIYDINNRLIKIIEIENKGHGAIDIRTGTLDSGTYIYEFIVDGEQIDTKKMVFAKY